MDRVLREVWRASGLVECVDGVARMRQARHRKMTQGPLDLERLNWDPREFQGRPSRGQTPSGLQGLDAPRLSFWEFPKLTLDEPRQQLSAKDDRP